MKAVLLGFMWAYLIAAYSARMRFCFLPQTAIPSMAAPVVTIAAVHSTGLASSPVFGEAGSSCFGASPEG